MDKNTQKERMGLRRTRYYMHIDNPNKIYAYKWED